MMKHNGAAIARDGEVYRRGSDGDDMIDIAHIHCLMCHSGVCIAGDDMVLRRQWRDRLIISPNPSREFQTTLLLFM